MQSRVGRFLVVVLVVGILVVAGLLARGRTTLHAQALAPTAAPVAVRPQDDAETPRMRHKRFETMTPGLGIYGISSAQPEGMRVVRFQPPPDPSPLKLLGVKEGDVITGCNGSVKGIREGVASALLALQRRGEPVTLEVVRGGRKIILKRSTKLDLTGHATARSSK